MSLENESYIQVGTDMAKKVQLGLVLHGQDAVRFEKYLSEEKTFTPSLQANLRAAVSNMRQNT